MPQWQSWQLFDSIVHSAVGPISNYREKKEWNVCTDQQLCRSWAPPTRRTKRGRRELQVGTPSPAVAPAAGSAPVRRTLPARRGRSLAAPSSFSTPSSVSWSLDFGAGYRARSSCKDNRPLHLQKQTKTLKQTETLLVSQTQCWKWADIIIINPSKSNSVKNQTGTSGSVCKIVLHTR